MHRRWHGDEHPETACSLYILGEILASQQRYADAEASHRQALSIFRKQYGDSHIVVSDKEQALARVLRARGDQTALDRLAQEQLAAVSERIRRHPTNPEAWLEQGIVENNIGHTNEDMFFSVKAAEFAAHSPPDVRYRVAVQCSQLAKSLSASQRYEQAERMYRTAISLREPLGEAPGELRLAQANDYNDLAFVLKPLKRLPEALEAVRAGLELKQQLVTEFPANRDYSYHIWVGQLASYRKLAELMLTSGPAQGAAAGAAACYQQVLELDEKLAAEIRENAGYRNELAGALAYLGLALEKAERPVEAEAAHRKALNLWRELSEEDPAHEWYRQERAHFGPHLAIVLQAAGRPGRGAGALPHERSAQ